MQNFVTSVLDGSDGFVALAVLYGCINLGTHFAPSVVQRLGLRASLALSASTYTFMNVGVAAAVTVLEGTAAARVLVMLTSAMCGLGAAVLWTAQGAYVTGVALGGGGDGGSGSGGGVPVERCQSAFFAIFSVNGVVGFSGALLCIDGLGLSDGAMLWVMAGASVLALASFALVPPLARSGQAQAQAQAQQGKEGSAQQQQQQQQQQPSMRAKLAQMLGLFRRRNIALTALASMHCGCMEGFFWGAVPAALSSSDTSRAFILHGATSALASWSVGRLTGSSGGRAAGKWYRDPKAVYVCLVLLSLLAAGLAVAGLRMGDEEAAQGGTRKSALLIGGIGVFGAADMPAQALLRALVGKEYAEVPELAASMSFVLFCLTVGNVLFFGLGPVVAPWKQGMLVAAIGVAAAAAFVLRDNSAKAPKVVGR